VQTVGCMRQQVPMLVNRAALDGHAVPDGRNRLIEPFPMTKTPLGEAATCLAVGEHCCGAVAGEPGQLGAAKDGWSSEWNKNPTSQNCLPGPILGWIIQPT
jgi:hypothetical protein